MKAANRNRLVSQIDEFLLAEKELASEFPVWSDSGRPYEMSARWPIFEAEGVTRAHLAFRHSRASTDQPSISVIFSGYPCYRIDLKKSNVCENNPLTAHKFGFPSVVCGTHKHPWQGNRDHNLSLRNGDWELPMRDNVSQDTRRLCQALAVLANDVKITLTADQRLFEPPATTGLF